MTRLQLAEIALVIILIAVVAYTVITAFMPMDQKTYTIYYVNEPETATKRIPRGFTYLPSEPECTGPNGEDCNLD